MLGGDGRRPPGARRGGQADGLRQRQPERAAVIGRIADMTRIMAGPQGAARSLSINRVSLAMQRTATFVDDDSDISASIRAAPDQVVQLPGPRRLGAGAFAVLHGPSGVHRNLFELGRQCAQVALELNASVEHPHRCVPQACHRRLLPAPEGPVVAIGWVASRAHRRCPVCSHEPPIDRDAGPTHQVNHRVRVSGPQRFPLSSKASRGRLLWRLRSRPARDLGLLSAGHDALSELQTVG